MCTHKSRCFLFAINNCSDADVDAVRAIKCHAIKAGRTYSADGVPRIQGAIYYHTQRSSRAVARHLGGRARMMPVNGSWSLYNCCLDGAETIRNEGSKGDRPQDNDGCSWWFCINHYTDADLLAITTAECVAMKAERMHLNEPGRHMHGIVAWKSAQSEAEVCARLGGNAAVVGLAGVWVGHPFGADQTTVVRNDGEMPATQDVVERYTRLLAEAIQADEAEKRRPRDADKLLVRYLREYNTIVWPPGHLRVVSMDETRTVTAAPFLTVMPPGSVAVYDHHSQLIQRITGAPILTYAHPNAVCEQLHTAAVKAMDELFKRRKWRA